MEYIIMTVKYLRKSSEPSGSESVDRSSPTKKRLDIFTENIANSRRKKPSTKEMNTCLAKRPAVVLKTRWL